MSLLPAPRAVRSLCTLACALLLSTLGATPALAQDEVPTVTRTVALENATVVQAPGQVLEGATVIVRDGLIEAVGADVAVPFDAQRIDADSLTIYAGFISGLAYTAVEEPESDGGSQAVEDPGNPPNDRAGIQPDRQARAMLDPSDSDVTSMREIGFTAAHVVPEGRMLPGAGAIIQLAGDAPHAMVLRGDASLYTQFEGGSGVYPATPMAGIAMWRQLYREAERRMALETQYAQAPRGQERPPSDPVHSAFFPVVDGAKPVFFHTEGLLEMHRALSLQRELGFSLALAGLHEGFRATDALQDVDAALFVSLDLPDKEEWSPPEPDTLTTDAVAADPDTLTTAADSAKAMTPPDPSSFFVRDFRTRSYEDTDDETENLKARQAIERETYYQNAAALHEAGLRFSFSTVDVNTRDVRANMRTMIDAGLPEDVALAALTTHPADMLGLSEQLGTVEPGKIANLVVTDGPYFAEDTAVRYVFVDGQPFEIEEAAPDPDASGDGGTANPVGAWEYTISTPQGDYGGTIQISGSPGDLEGTITSDLESEASDLENLELNGTTLTFEFDAGDPGQVSVRAAITGDEMEGSVNVPNFDAVVPLSATRTSDPD
jgi:hypothetical protein